MNQVQKELSEVRQQLNEIEVILAEQGTTQRDVVFHERRQKILKELFCELLEQLSLHQKIEDRRQEHLSLHIQKK